MTITQSSIERMDIGDHILTTVRDRVRLIQLNRPKQKNAITQEMYKWIGATLNGDAVNDEIVVTIFTGSGEYFSSGNDIKSAIATNSALADVDSGSRTAVIKDLIDAFINYPKLLIAVVNGPAIGIGATITALCDIIYAADTAHFSTPFIKLGLCTEACSSLTYPLILGRSKASEVLLLGELLSAQEAHKRGFVARVIPTAKIAEFITDLYKYGKLPLEGVKGNKRLLMAPIKKTLLECCDRELKFLNECFESDQFINSVMQFLTKKSKL